MKIVANLLVCILWLLFTSFSQCVYVFPGNPFQQNGPLSIASKTLNAEVYGNPVHTVVFYPSVQGVYVPILFIPGFDGVVYPEFYSTVTTALASYGYVVAAMDLYWPTRISNGLSNAVITALGSNADRSFKMLEWLQMNLVQKVLPSQEIYNVTIDWNKLGLLSHSSGANVFVQMIKENSTFSHGAAFLEPFTDILDQPLKYSHPMPSLSYGTEYCMEFPPCCIRGESFDHVYDSMPCPKIVMNIAGYGHCDILDEVPGWTLCHDSHFCKTVDNNNRKLYREVFLPGVMASFFGQYLQERNNLISLITKADNMPVRLLELSNDLDCY